MYEIEHMSNSEVREQLKKQLIMAEFINKELGTVKERNKRFESEVSELREQIDTICTLIKQGYRIEFYSYDKYDPQAIYPQEEAYFVGVTKDSIGAKDQIGQNGYIEDRKLSEYLVKTKEAVDKQRGKVLGELIKGKLQGSD